MFVIGAAPALIVIVMRLYMPESPRWLAAHGRSIDEAQRVMDTIERVVSRGGMRPLPPVVSRTTQIEMTTRRRHLRRSVPRDLSSEDIRLVDALAVRFDRFLWNCKLDADDLSNGYRHVPVGRHCSLTSSPYWDRLPAAWSAR